MSVGTVNKKLAPSKMNSSIFSVLLSERMLNYNFGHNILVVYIVTSCELT